MFVVVQVLTSRFQRAADDSAWFICWKALDMCICVCHIYWSGKKEWDVAIGYTVTSQESADPLSYSVQLDVVELAAAGHVLRACRCNYYYTPADISAVCTNCVSPVYICMEIEPFLPTTLLCVFPPWLQFVFPTFQSKEILYANQTRC